MNKVFYVLSEAWYASTILKDEIGKPVPKVDDVYFGMDDIAEMSMEWLQLTKGAPTPHLTAFDDSWAMFTTIPELFTDLAKYGNVNFSVKEFCNLLVLHGFKDVTTCADPSAPKEPPVKRNRKGEPIDDQNATKQQTEGV